MPRVDRLRAQHSIAEDCELYDDDAVVNCCLCGRQYPTCSRVRTIDSHRRSCCQYIPVASAKIGNFLRRASRNFLTSIPYDFSHVKYLQEVRKALEIRYTREISPRPVDKSTYFDIPEAHGVRVN